MIVVKPYELKIMTSFKDLLMTLKMRVNVESICSCLENVSRVKHLIFAS